MQFFQLNGKLYIIKKDKNEPIKKYIDRAWFIANKKPQNKKEMEKITTLSRIYSNECFLGCKYNVLNK